MSAEQRVLQHTAWMESCSNGAVEFLEIDKLDTYAADVSHTNADDVVSCLLSRDSDAALPETIVGTPESLGILFRAPFYDDNNYPMRREAFTVRAALIRTADAVYVVQSNADPILSGVIKLHHVKGSTFSQRRCYS